MTGVLALLLVAGCVAGFGFLVVRAGRPAGGPARSLRELAGYRSPGSVGPLATGLVSAVAFAGLPGAGGAVAIGPLLGLVFAVLGLLRARVVMDVVAAAAGVLGLAGAIVVLLTGASCSPFPLLARVGVLLLLGLAVAGGAVIAAVGLHLSGRSLLATYGAVRVVTFLSAPLGISILGLPWLVWVLVPAVAVLFGFAAWTAPALVIGTTSVGIGLASVSVAGLEGTACRAGAQPGELGLLAGYLVGYGLVRAVGGWLRDRVGAR